MSLEELSSARASKGQHRHKRQLLKQQLRLQKRKTPEGRDRWEMVPLPEPHSFEKGFFLFIRAVQLLSQENDGVILVGLAGPSGAGKTVFSEKVTAFMPGISLISMDNYNVASRVIDGNFDDPRITDYDLLLENIASLRRGEAAQVPIYDFKTSSRVGSKTVAVPSSRIVIIEGIYALSERLRPMMDLRVSITGGVHFDLVKRVLRDIDRSGQPPEEIISQISETVYPMYKAFIEPDLETAHIKIVNKFNPFSGFQNATYILKAPADDMGEEALRQVLSATHKESTEETYDIYLLPPGEDKETCISYLRMRNRDGRYSLMFEEWVTDGPFVITPRITFEVSVRLLGGLMALGYEVAHVIKRESFVFKDKESGVTVKLDHLEQLSRDYVQVQGKDRAKVKELGDRLGLEGKYISKPYIEQILLENLTKEVEAPKANSVLKERFQVSDDFLTVSPGGETLVTPRTSQASSWSDHSFVRPLSKSHSYQHRLTQDSQTNGHLLGSPDSASEAGPGDGEAQHGRRHGGSGLGRLKEGEASGAQRRGWSEGHAPPAAASETLQVGRELDRIVGCLDELLSRMDTIESRIATGPPLLYPAHVSTPRPSDAPPPTPAFANPAQQASASALSNQITAAFGQNGPVGTGPSGFAHSHASPLATNAALGHGTPRSSNGGHGTPWSGNGGHGTPRNGNGGHGMVALELPAGLRGSLDHNGGGSSGDFLDAVRMLSRNQSRMADELLQLKSLNGMLRESLDKQMLALETEGIVHQASWRLEAIMSASAVVSLACASALLFTFLKSSRS